MTPDFLVIAPESQPGSGGVGDYTARLLEHLPGRAELLTPPLDYHQLPQTGGRVLVQYSAYGFDRHGYPGKLIHELVDWKRRTNGRLVVMFHEIWTFWPLLNKNYFVQLLHRRAIKHLVGHADAVFTSTADQVDHLNHLDASRRVQLLPVGSNIRPMSHNQIERLPGSAVIFGLQRARIRALRRMHSALKALASSKNLVRITSVGAGKSADLEQEELGLLADLPLPNGFAQLGSQPEEQVSKLLLSASFGIFGQNELSITKSGSFMAYAAHGLNVIADCAGVSKGEPMCWLVAPDELTSGIPLPELHVRREKLHRWQEHTAGWEMISNKVAEALQLTAGTISAGVSSR